MALPTSLSLQSDERYLSSEYTALARTELSCGIFRAESRHRRSELLTPIMESLGIKFPGFGGHTFRRMHLGLMSKKLSLFDLRHQAGHADIRTTAKYAGDDQVERAKAASELPKIEKLAAVPFIVRKKVG